MYDERTVFPVSALVGAAVRAAVCRWGLSLCCPDARRCLSGVYNHHRNPHHTHKHTNASLVCERLCSFVSVWKARATVSVADLPWGIRIHILPWRRHRNTNTRIPPGSPCI